MPWRSPTGRQLDSAQSRGCQRPAGRLRKLLRQRCIPCILHERSVQRTRESVSQWLLGSNDDKVDITLFTEVQHRATALQRYILHAALLIGQSSSAGIARCHEQLPDAR